MIRDAGLTPNSDAWSRAGGTGESDLCRNQGLAPDVDVVTDVDVCIELGAPTNSGWQEHARVHAA
jgi:hypothetical protein